MVEPIIKAKSKKWDNEAGANGNGKPNKQPERFPLI